MKILILLLLFSCSFKTHKTKTSGKTKAQSIYPLSGTPVIKNRELHLKLSDNSMVQVTSTDREVTQMLKSKDGNYIAIGWIGNNLQVIQDESDKYRAEVGQVPYAIRVVDLIKGKVNKISSQKGEHLYITGWTDENRLELAKCGEGGCDSSMFFDPKGVKVYNLEGKRIRFREEGLAFYRASPKEKSQVLNEYPVRGSPFVIKNFLYLITKAGSKLKLDKSQKAQKAMLSPDGRFIAVEWRGMKEVPCDKTMVRIFDLDRGTFIKTLRAPEVQSCSLKLEKWLSNDQVIVGTDAKSEIIEID